MVSKEGCLGSQRRVALSPPFEILPSHVDVRIFQIFRRLGRLVHLMIENLSHSSIESIEPFISIILSVSSPATYLPLSASAFTVCCPFFRLVFAVEIEKIEVVITCSSHAWSSPQLNRRDEYDELC